HVNQRYDGYEGPNRFYYPQRFVEGDNISIISGGNFIGKGAFLRIEGYTLIWCDRPVSHTGGSSRQIIFFTLLTRKSVKLIFP
ncbi:hypothetical protein ACT453_54855, partial [Bacillus sp. D-CC]